MSNAFRNSAFVGFALLIALIVANAFVSYRHLRRLLDNQQGLNHTNATQLALKETLSLLKDLELGESGYVITGNPMFLEPYQHSVARLDVQLARLEQSVAASSGERDDVVELRELIQQRRDLAQEAIRLRDEQGADEAAGLVAAGTGKMQMDQIRQLAQEIEEHETGMEAAWARQSKESFETALASFAMATTAALALVGLVFLLVRRDAIEGRRTAELLRASEQRFRRLVDANVMGVLFTTFDGRVTEANDAFLRMIGFSRDELLAGKVDWRSLTPPEHLERDERAIAEIKARGASSPFEKDFLRKNGTRVPVMMGCARLEGPRQTCICYAVDLSERERARREIETLNAVCLDRIQELETLLEVIPIGIAIAQDPRCENVTANAAFARTLGVPRRANASLTGTGTTSPSHVVLRNGEEVPPEELPMQVAAATGRAVLDVELDIVREEGSTIKVLEHVAPLFDASGRPRGAVGAFVDITERKRLENQLRQNADDLRNQQRWLEAILNLLPMPMLLLDTARARVTFANRAAEEMADGVFPLGTADGGESPEYYCTDRSGERIGPEQMPGARVARGERLSGFEMDWHLPDGTRSLLVNADSLPGMHGHEEVSTLLFQDITRLKQIEAELRRTNQAKDALLAMLGHELRNPLAAITSAAELIQLQDPADEMYQQAQQILNRHIQHLARLVDDMLDLSRLTSGKLVLRTEIIALADIVEHAVQTATSLMEARGHRLQVSLPKKPVYVRADKPRLEQVFVNLLVNAAKYTDPGGKIDVTAKVSGREVTVGVRDNGIGIAPEMLPRVFDLFAQLNPSLDRAEGGLGIGLNVVRNLVELHGGHVSVHSEGLGRGTEFLVRLPISQEAPTRLPSLPSPGPHNGVSATPSRVLIVEDNTDIARVMVALLKRCGHVPQVAHDGAAALDLAREFHPDVALLDIGLPDMSGHELARQLREDEAFKNTYLVALTGYGQQEDRRRSAEAGFDEHLTKPVSLDMLREVLNHAHDAVSS